MRLAVAVFFVLSGASRAAEIPADQLAFLETKIRPALVEHCYECHSGRTDEPEGGLRLDYRQGVLNGGESGPSITAGKPSSSLLTEAIGYASELQMPPDDKLPESVITDFRRWIEMGAPDPRDETPKSKARRVLYDQSVADAHWAYQPIKAFEPPRINDPWVRNPIDAFVFESLRESGLEPSPPAPKDVLLRRVSYGLVGLPFLGEPGGEEWRERSFKQAVDALLASEQYGVHWGRHWLDIARYADNNGDRLAKSGRNPYYPYAWTYRDWVIDVFNRDMPYDRFVLHQLAGDSFATEDDRRPIAALGFLRVGRMFGQNVDNRIDDRIDALSKGLLGLTVGCARCHDHKFDPVLTRDYYALHGILNNTEDVDLDLVPRERVSGYAAYVAQRQGEYDEVKARALDGIEALISGYVHQTDKLLLAAQKFLDGHTKQKVAAVAARELEIKADIFAAWVASLKKWEVESNRVFTPWFRMVNYDANEYMKIEYGRWDVHPVVVQRILNRRPKNRDELAKLYRDLAVDVEAAAGRHFPIAELIVNWTNHQRRWIPEEYDPFAEAPAPLEDPEMEELRQVLLGFAGPWGGPQLPPQLLNRSGASDFRSMLKIKSFELIKRDGEDPRAPVIAMAMRDVAEPTNSPVFIRGDNKNPGEEAPRGFLSHLAGDNPQPYTQGSGRLDLAHDIVDPKNPLTPRVIVNRVWQWHFGEGLVPTSSDFGLNGVSPSHPELLDWLSNRFVENGWSIKKLHRLILASNTYRQSSGPRPDGLEVDPSNRLLWRFSPRKLKFEEIRDSMLLASGELDLSVGGRATPQGEDSRRRTAYLYVDRYQLPYRFQIFDFPSPDFSTAQRESSIVPPQGLYFLNDPWLAERAVIIAEHARLAGEAPEAQITALWQSVYQREPEKGEVKFAMELLMGGDSRLIQVAHSLLCTNEFVFVR